MQEAEDLQVQHGVLDEAAIAAYVFVIYFRFADVAFVLDLYEIYLSNEATHLNDVADDTVRWHSLQQLNRIVCGEVVNFFFNSANHA